MHHGSHHVARRIRAGTSTYFDRFMLVIGTAAAFMTLPQLISVYQNGASGVSLLSWSAYAAHSALWTAYGIAHGERAIIWPNAAWGLMNGMVVLAIIFAD